MFFKKHFGKHTPRLGALEVLKYIGPGFLVTVGFIDPGNWAANVAAGFPIRICPSLDGHPLYHYAYNTSA